jgi:hypothetical protein
VGQTGNRDYEVGFGKPPKHTRFQKGHSGNPRGRPRGSLNTSTLLEQALKEKVVVSENGRRKKVSKHRAILKQLVNKAAQGDHRAIQLLLMQQIPKLEELEAERVASAAPLHPDVQDGHLGHFIGAVEIILESGAVPPNLLRAMMLRRPHDNPGAVSTLLPETDPTPPLSASTPAHAIDAISCVTFDEDPPF